ncbi:MAG: nickel-responsive transcriptional regulator NikR [Bacteroidales bacterium]|nr:nickel-responsive transcriptional regulator NikR [Bacteroidales bacterium]
MSVVRFSVSLEEKLLKELDDYVGNNNFANRSQGLRYLIEKKIVEEKWQCNNIVAGAVIIIYDHQKKEIITRSNEIRHDYFDVILSTQYFHLNKDICLEVIAVRGKAKKLTELADNLIAIKGIKHGKLLMSKTD